MNRLFWGLFFVLLDYKITVGRAVFEILPDFVGFFLLMRGMESMADRSSCFNRGRHWAFAMALVSGVLYIGDLSNPGTMMKVWLWVGELAVLAVSLGLVKTVIKGLCQIGKKGTELRNSIGMILVVILPMCHLTNWIPVVGTVSGWAAILASGVFLAAFLKNK